MLPLLMLPALFQATFSFAEVVESLKAIGFFEYLLPFLLVFAIIFAILEKTAIFGTGKTNINVVISTAIALLLIIQQGIVQIINTFLPRVSLILIVILMFLIVITLLAGDRFRGLSGTVFSVAVIIVIIALILALVTPVTAGFDWLSAYERAALMRWAIPLAIFLLIVYFITRSGTGGEEGSLTKALKGFEKGLKGKE